MKKHRMKALLCYALVLLMIWVVIPVSADADIYHRVLRLHVLADDDSPEAQETKLAVRDEMLRLSRELFAECESRRMALEIFQEKKQGLEEALNGFLAARGASYGARIHVGEERYDTREYENLRLPAGTYLSVQVVLGRGEGKNWWCVLFPPLCLSCAKAEDSLVEQGLGEESAKVFTWDTPRYRFRFRILEILGSWFG